MQLSSGETTEICPARLALCLVACWQLIAIHGRSGVHCPLIGHCIDTMTLLSALLPLIYLCSQSVCPGSRVSVPNGLSLFRLSGNGSPHFKFVQFPVVDKFLSADLFELSICQQLICLLICFPFIAFHFFTWLLTSAAEHPKHQ